VDFFVIAVNNTVFGQQFIDLSFTIGFVIALIVLVSKLFRQLSVVPD